MKRGLREGNRHDLAKADRRVQLAERRDVGYRRVRQKENSYGLPQDVEVSTSRRTSRRRRQNMIMSPHASPINAGNSRLGQTCDGGTVVRAIIRRLMLAVHGANGAR